jgi:hypothetical protein
MDVSLFFFTSIKYLLRLVAMDFFHAKKKKISMHAVRGRDDSQDRELSSDKQRRLGKAATAHM